ncbi:MAG: methyltransferase domain-containing protein [Alphaproteobacteria bacterium]|nr:methyltransferase domain-containing protein [Alphaproteobacteria bacterium]MBL7099792.1 methyltransferase domain-containing protein [Alphaproteobacteria bacterium]
MSEEKFGSWEAAVVWLREQPEFEQVAKDAYYDDPLASASLRYWSSEEWASIRALLGTQRGRALDVGAGRGIASYALAKDGFEVVALEPDPSPLVGAQAIRSLAQTEELPIEVSESYSEKLPFADASFDLVFARAVLHHTKDLASACAEYFRVLRPNGRFLAVREHVISKQRDLPAFLDAHPLHKLYGGENAFLLSQYISAIRGAGFNSVIKLSPFESPINYAPRTRGQLLLELEKRANRIPGARFVTRSIFRSGPGITLVLKLLSIVDNRPGRLYSFLACKR